MEGAQWLRTGREGVVCRRIWVETDRRELDVSRLGWRLRRWDGFMLGRREHGGSVQAAELELVRLGSRGLTEFIVSKLGRRDLSSSGLGRREVSA